MSRPLRLAIDLDGVVADFNGGWMARYNEAFGADLSPDLVQFWDGLYELTHFADMRAFWRWARDHGSHSVFRHLEPYPDALPSLRRLFESGHDIVIVTAKPDWAIHDTFEWLAEHAVPTREVHVTEEKYRVDCDVYLDDSPYQVPELVEHRGDRAVCRFVRAWNEPVAGAIDVVDWSDFERVVGEVSNGR